jgi:hypothetical protein
MNMNRWHVYAFMKAVFMETGKLPQWQDIYAAFPDLPDDEIREGVAEFEAVLKWGA